MHLYYVKAQQKQDFFQSPSALEGEAGCTHGSTWTHAGRKMSCGDRAAAVLYTQATSGVCVTPSPPACTSPVGSATGTHRTHLPGQPSQDPGITPPLWASSIQRSTRLWLLTPCPRPPRSWLGSELTGPMWSSPTFRHLAPY